MPRKRPAKGGPQKKKSRSSSNQNTSRRKHLQRSTSSPNYADDIPAIVSAGSSESLEPVPIHFKLIRHQNKPTEDPPTTFSLDEQLGFFIMESRNASFADIRAAIAEEVDADSLPGDAWKFSVPSLGVISTMQEQLVGPVVAWLEKRFGGRLGDGSAQNPFLLFLSVSSQAEVSHD
jgi:hypothetical protein